MIDINGYTIKIGDKVHTQQKPGGILPPAPGETGIVEATKDAFERDTLQIRFRKPGKDYDQFILLEGKINQIIL